MKDKQSNIKDFTRGGQIFLHNLRMLYQVFSKVMYIGSFILFLSIAIWLMFHTTPYERYLVRQKLWADVLVFFEPKAKQEFILPNGKSLHAFSQQIVNADFVTKAADNLRDEAIKGLGMSLCIYSIALAGISSWLKYHGKAQSENKHIKGDTVLDKDRLKKLIIREKQNADILISELAIIADSETSHFLIHGTTGTGKSVCIKELLDQIRARGDKAIIYDKNCDLIQYYYQPKTDILLNPLDERGSAWHLWDECRDIADFDSLTAALMPMPEHMSDPFWMNAARTIFAVSAAQMRQDKERSMFKLLKLLLSADLNQLEYFLRGTEAESLVSEKIEKTAISIKSVIATYSKSLKYIKDEPNPFSIRQWVHDEKSKGWLFITSQADKHETLKPLISMWLNLSANALMSLNPSPTRRIWMILDELPSLQRLPYLSEAFAESRKFGGCLVIGMQSYAQLRKIYGRDAAEEITGLCNTRVFFSTPASATAQWVSRELGQCEIDEVHEGISYGASTNRDGVNISRQRVTKNVVQDSEIINLKKLEAFVRLPGSWPITKIKLKIKARKIREKAFMPIALNDDKYKEVDSIIEQHTKATPLQVTQTVEDKLLTEENAHKRERKSIIKTKQQSECEFDMDV